MIAIWGTFLVISSIQGNCSRLLALSGRRRLHRVFHVIEQLLILSGTAVLPPGRQHRDGFEDSGRHLVLNGHVVAWGGNHAFDLLGLANSDSETSETVLVGHDQPADPVGQDVIQEQFQALRMIVHPRTEVRGEHHTVPCLVFVAPDRLSGHDWRRAHRPRFFAPRRQHPGIVRDPTSPNHRDDGGRPYVPG
jgi:hypothetical protein